MQSHICKFTKNANHEEKVTEQQVAYEELQDKNTNLEEEATKQQAAHEALQDENTNLEKEATKQQAAREALQDKNANLEEEATKQQVAYEALQDKNTNLEEEATKQQAAHEVLQDKNTNLEEEVTKWQVTHEALQGISTNELLEINKELLSFVNSIAHDFRSPMTNIKGFSRVLEESLSEMEHHLREELVLLSAKAQEEIKKVMEKKVPESLKYISASVDRLDKMINALLALSRIGKRQLVLQDIDMAHLVNDVCHSFKHQTEINNIQITVGKLPTVMSDNVAMEQIIGNLVDNAIKYLAPGRPGKITVNCKKDKERYIFRVEDNGRGIDEKDIEKIFQLFHRSGQQDVTGDGMGLAYVRKTISQLGGRVWCESEIGVGTKMMFTVPMNYA